MKAPIYFRYILVGFFAVQQLYSATIDKTLYINRGDFITVLSTALPSLAFNPTSVYDTYNEVIDIGTTDSLKIKIINNDTIVHGFDIKNYAGVSQVILPGDSAEITVYFGNESVWVYYDQLNYPENRYMGLAGMICVSNSTHQKFYWNFKEHETMYNINIANGIPVNWNTYYPDYFTVNGKSFPEIQNHNLAVPNVYLGDTILIFAINTGQSKHSIHFHGFHASAQYAFNPQQLNWSKDTWPMGSMDCYIWRVVFDKVGQYTVHDHNLVAVSGGGVHPNGMFLIMTVE